MPDDTYAKAITTFLSTTIPKIKTRIQLAGVVFSIAAYVIIKIVAPSNIHAQISGGAVGVCLIVFGLVFPYIDQFPARDRAKLVLGLFAMFGLVVLALVISTGYFLATAQHQITSEALDAVTARLTNEEKTLEKQRDELDARLKEERDMLPYAEWDQIRQTRQTVLAEIEAIRTRIDNLSDVATRMAAIGDELRRIAAGADYGLPAGLRNDANDAQKAFYEGDFAQAKALFAHVTEAGDRAAADGLFWSARIDEVEGKLDDAKSKYLSALSRDADNPKLIEAAARISVLRGEYGEARDLFSRLVDARKRQGAAPGIIAVALRDLATMHRFLDEIPEARRTFEDAFALAQSQRAHDATAVALVANDFGGFYWQTCEYAEAEQMYQLALDIYKEKAYANEYGYAEAENNLGLLYYSEGRYGDAETVLTRSLERARDTVGPRTFEYANNRANLGALYLDLGEFRRSEDFYARATKTGSDIVGDDHIKVARFNAGWGEMYLAAGDYKKALEKLLLAQEVMMTTVGASSRFTVSAQERLAEVYLQLGNIGRASEMLKPAVAFVNEKHDVSPLLNSRVYRAQAMIETELGQLDAAARHLASATAVEKKIWPVGHREYVLTLIQSSRVALKKGSLIAARDALDQAQTLAASIFPVDHPLRARINEMLVTIAQTDDRASH
jgi:tetratricopeptide (TPR) repeat protein